jgi:hypothetical protein
MLQCELEGIMKCVTVVAIGTLLFYGCAHANKGNFVQVWKSNVYAKGVMSDRSTEHLGWLEIDLRTLGGGAISNVSLEIKGYSTLGLASVTPGLLKEFGAVEWIGRDKEFGGDRAYFFECFEFCFAREVLIGFKVNEYGFPPREGRRVNMVINKESNSVPLTIPCSLQEFESAFGSADRVTRGWAL